ncbi:hypothetical protein SRDD_38560 [Serratia sp. DD3]|nr:hypothetical protein SRDD_38560 [Serratia sp. DD3]
MAKYRSGQDVPKQVHMVNIMIPITHMPVLNMITM